MRLYKYIIIIIIVICFIVGSGCIFKDDKGNENKDTSNFQYVVNVYSTNDIEYYIHIPVPLNETDKNISPIVNYLKVINGDGNYNIILTNHGIAINLTGQRNLTLFASEQEFIPYAYLSLSNSSINIYEDDEYYIYIYLNSLSDNKTIRMSIDITLYIWHDNESFGFNIENEHITEEIDIGLNKIKIINNKIEG